MSDRSTRLAEPGRSGEPVRLIAPDGTFVEHPTFKLSLSADELRTIYLQLVAVRRIDEEGMRLQRQGYLGLWIPCRGQEAAQVGSAWALEPDDWVVPSYREHGVALARGMDMARLFALFRGVTNGGWSPADERFGLYTIPIGTQVAHAVGFAIGTGMDGIHEAVICYLGDGATSEGATLEAFNFAGVTRAPVVFLCQNNQWAVSLPVAKQSAAPLYRRAGAFGFPGVCVDGNDALAVCAVTRDAAQRARDGGGPTLVEAITYRLGPHTSSDDPVRYRPAGELEQAEVLDPLPRYRKFLQREGLYSETLEEQATTLAEEQASSIRSAVEGMADPAPADLVDHAFVDPPLTLRREWDELMAFEAAFEPR